jgi:hypothetical protein
MNRLQDVIYLTKDVFKQATALIKVMPILLAVPAIHLTFYLLAMQLGVLNMGMFSGLIQIAVNAVILSSYFYVLHQAIYYKRFKIAYLYQGIQVFFFKTFFFMIVLNLFTYLMALTGSASLLGRFLIWVPFILFNPMPEIIYISEYSERDMLFYNFNFIKKNYLPWYGVNLIFMLVLLGVIIVSGMMAFIANILLLVYIGFTMLMRGYLFKKLHAGNFRKRQLERFND